MSLLIWLKMNHEVDYQPTKTFTSTFTYYDICICYTLLNSHVTDPNSNRSHCYSYRLNIYMTIACFQSEILYSQNYSRLFITSLNVVYIYIVRKRSFFLRVKLKTGYINFTDYFDRYSNKCYLSEGCLFLSAVSKYTHT